MVSELVNKAAAAQDCLSPQDGQQQFRHGHLEILAPSTIPGAQRWSIDAHIPMALHPSQVNLTL